MKFKKIVMVLGLVLCAAAHADTVLNYQFDAGSTFSLGGGFDYAATGTFSFDVTTGQVINVAYDAVEIGVSPAGPLGPFNFTGAETLSPTDVIFKDDCCFDTDEFFFARSLAGGGTIAITGANYPGLTNLDITGSGSVSVIAVPEPADWALMLAGLSVLGFTLRRRAR